MGRKYFKVCRENSLKEFSGGFTLIEALIVIAALGLLILLMVLLIKPKSQIDKSRDSRRQSDLQKMAIALEDYLNDKSVYPAEDVLSECGNNDSLEPYLDKIPCDPETNAPYLYERPEGDKFVVYASLKTRNLDISYGGKGNYIVSSPNYRLEPSGVTPPVLSPTPRPTLSGLYYGCFSGICQQLTGYLCEPNYLSSGCYGQCGSPAVPRNECE